MAWSVSMGHPKNAYCGRHVSAAVDFRLRAQVRSPRFGPRSRCQELNPGPSYRRNRSRGVRPLGQAGPAGSGWRTLGRENATADFNSVFAGAPLSMARPITSPFVRAEPVVKRSCPLVCTRKRRAAKRGVLSWPLQAERAYATKGQRGEVKTNAAECAIGRVASSGRESA